MKPGWRLFVALPLPEPTLDALEGRLAALRTAVPAARWVAGSSMHLTLHFLGDQPESVVPELQTVLGSVSAAWEPFPIAVQGAGSFGRADGRSRVVWLGLDREGRAAVASLATDVGAALERLPLQNAARSPERMRIHLTVARRAPDDLPDRVGAAVQEGPPIGWLADRMRLYRSHLEARGPRHESLWTGRFGRHPVRLALDDGR